MTMRERLDPETAEAVRSSYRACQAGNLLRARCWQRVSHTLSGAGIPHLPLKGMDLILQGFFTETERPMKDIDLLVPVADVSKAVAHLEKAGYLLHHELPGQMVLDAEPGSLEVHYRILPPESPLPPLEPGIWDRSRPGAEKGSGRSLSAEDRALYLVLHYYLGEVRRVRSLSLLRDLHRVLAHRSQAPKPTKLWDIAADVGAAPYLSRRLGELDRLGLLPRGFLPPPKAALRRARPTLRQSVGFRLAEQEALRRITSDRREGTEPGLRFYGLFWCRWRRIPRLLLGAAATEGGGLVGRAARIIKRFTGRD